MKTPPPTQADRPPHFDVPPYPLSAKSRVEVDTSVDVGSDDIARAEGNDRVEVGFGIEDSTNVEVDTSAEVGSDDSARVEGNDRAGDMYEDFDTEVYTNEQSSDSRADSGLWDGDGGLGISIQLPDDYPVYPDAKDWVPGDSPPVIDEIEISAGKYERDDNTDKQDKEDSSTGLRLLSGVRAKNEGSTAVRLCNEFLLMGINRSLLAVAEKFGRSHGDVKNLSSRYKWISRAEMFDSEHYALKLKEYGRQMEKEVHDIEPKVLSNASVMEELSMIVNMRVTDVYDFDTKTGKLTLNPEKLAQNMHLVETVKYDATGQPRIELKKPSSALALLMKHYSSIGQMMLRAELEAQKVKKEKTAEDQDAGTAFMRGLQEQMVKDRRGINDD